MDISYVLQKFTVSFETKHLEELSDFEMKSAFFFYKIQVSKFSDLSVISNCEENATE